MSAATARKITLLIDGIQIGTGKLWDGVVIDCGTRWSEDPALTEAVNYRIECAIRKGCDTIVYVDDSGKRSVIAWEIE